MSVDSEAPTTTEAEVVESLRLELICLDEDLTGQEQLLACYEELYPELLDRRSRFVFPWARMVYMHWAAIGVRRLFRRGSRPQNVSISGLLQRLAKTPSLIRRLGEESVLRKRLNLGTGDITDDLVVAFLKSEGERLDQDTADIKEYADTIAHLQREGVRLKKERIVAALKTFRDLLNDLHALIGIPRSDFNKARFVNGFEEELAALLRPTQEPA